MTTADNDARAAQLVRALEVSVLGDASSLEELFTSDVTGLSPILSCTSLAEFAVELEEQEDVFTEVAIEVHPLDVAGDRACVEWVASAVHSGPLPLDEDETVATGPAVAVDRLRPQRASRSLGPATGNRPAENGTSRA